MRDLASAFASDLRRLQLLALRARQFDNPRVDKALQAEAWREASLAFDYANKLRIDLIRGATRDLAEFPLHVMRRTPGPWRWALPMGWKSLRGELEGLAMAAAVALADEAARAQTSKAGLAVDSMRVIGWTLPVGGGVSAEGEEKAKGVKRSKGKAGRDTLSDEVFRLYIEVVKRWKAAKARGVKRQKFINESPNNDKLLAAMAYLRSSVGKKRLAAQKRPAKKSRQTLA